ncbi:MAG: glycosyltransferase family 39 protein [Acetobacter sp.]|nr:glycosyltransferase family 39 protein [Acetobacter sp.]
MELVLKFLGCAGAFIAATAVAVCYQLDVAKINLWLAMAVVLWLNPMRLSGRRLAISGVFALILALVALIISAKVWNVWLFAGFIVVLWGISEKDDYLNSHLLIYTAAFFNLSIISNTAYTNIQYDFASCFNYIEYILENNFMFWQENPLLTRPSYSTYHPILHFFLAAGIIRIVQFFTINTIAAVETAQVLFCSYMLWYYFIAARILRLLDIHSRAYLAGVAFIVFFPAYNAIAGFFNNDCLLLPLQAGAVYYALCYYKDGGQKNLIYIWLFATAATLTKLSGVLVLPMVAAALGLRLWQIRDKKTFYELAVFGVCLLLGISVWTIYQHFFLGVSAGFVPPQEHLSLKPYSLWQRFNPFGAIIYEKMFYNDFGINLWETMTKTALFGQWDFSLRGAGIMGMISILAVIYKLILIMTMGMIMYLLWSMRRNVYVWLALILILSLLFGQIMFGLMHPYMCNQDFRYVAILPLPVAMVWSLGLNNISCLGQKISFVLFGGFAILSAFVWWYVVSFGG